MKIVIEIDDKLYNRIKYLEPKADAMLDKLMRSIQNGTPLPKGHWEDCSNGWMCSNCNRDVSYESNFCPNCGADMRVAPDFESEEYINERINNYNKMLKSGILDYIMEKLQESEDEE